MTRRAERTESLFEVTDSAPVRGQLVGTWFDPEDLEILSREVLEREFVFAYTDNAAPRRMKGRQA